MTTFFEPLLVIWEDRLAVGQLEYDPLSGWRFRYGQDVTRAISEGFRAVPGFPEVEPGVWHHAPTLSPGLKKSLPALHRTDVQKILGDHAKASGEGPLYWYLNLTGGKVVGRGLRFVPLGSFKASVGAGITDEAVSNELRRVVKACRELLEADVRRQMEGRLGIAPGGRPLPLDDLPALMADDARRIEREDVLTAITHLEVKGLAREEAYARFVRESAFTTLNRLAALKLMEQPDRGLLRETIGASRDSKGFRDFARVAPGAVSSKDDGGYQFYLECVYDEVAEEVGVLFDRTDASSLLFPSMATLDRVIGLLNAEAIASVWGDDETLGWIYQFFTPQELRDETHKKRGRGGPKDSYELAFLNQFYTPRYVVEFLVRNTLEAARKDRDPLELRILDPACGSGHFLLHAFDMLMRTYQETYDDELRGTSLRAAYPEREPFLREIPRLILANNLYGVDIDLRAVQIASLALYLRAQRAWGRMRIRASERPVIDRLNIVLAEAMPGENALFEEFLESELDVPLARDLARGIWQKMAQANEIGSLLKITEELRDDVTRARQQLSKQRLLPFEDQPEDRFFDDLDQTLLNALSRYIANAGNLERRIFGRDSEEGVRFLDVVRRRYDVVLMNPPFGRPSHGSASYVRRAYPKSYNDLAAAFVERGLDLLKDDGYLGAITSRTGFFLSSFQAWREDVLLKHRFRFLADFGSGVLDATVEVAAYVVQRGGWRSGTDQPALFLRLLLDSDKARALATAESEPNDARRYVQVPSDFRNVETAPFAYWLPGELRAKFTTGLEFEPQAAEVRQGLSTAADDVFVRLAWEVVPQDMDSRAVAGPQAVVPAGRRRWAFHVKSGSSQPWYAPLLAVVNWENDGREIKARFVASGESPSRYVRSEDRYFLPGFSWTRRAARFIPYVVPAGAIPSASRYQAFPLARNEALALGVTASNIATAYLRLFGEKFAWPNFLVENLKSLPWPLDTVDLKAPIEALVYREVARRRDAYSYFEPYQDFVAPLALDSPERPAEVLAYDPRTLLGRDLELTVSKAYGFNADELEVLERDLMEALAARRPGSAEASTDDTEEEGDDSGSEAVVEDTPATRAEGLVSYALGCLFGRWDVRIGRDRGLSPKPCGPFDPLPFVPPGTLVGPDGFAATPDTIVTEEWLRARPDVLHLPAPPGPTLQRGDYPLDVAWSGILPDDPDDGRDVVRGIERVLGFLYGERAPDVQEQICRAIGVKDLRTYIRNPRAFFAAHIQRYSALKGKRKAPIYWLLQSPDRTYGLWVYYHRVSNDTLYVALRDFLEPRLRRAEATLAELKGRATEKGRARATDIGAAEEALGDLIDLRDKIEAARKHWAPNLDDGVLLNAAPLHEVIPWPNVKKTWKDLQEGKHEWSAISIHLRS